MKDEEKPKVWTEKSRVYWRAQFRDESGKKKKYTFGKGKNNRFGYVLHKNEHSREEVIKVVTFIAAGLYVKYLHRYGFFNALRTKGTPKAREHKLKQLYELLFYYHRFYSISQFAADLKGLGFEIDNNLKLNENGEFISSDSVQLKHFSQRNKIYSYYGKKLTLREWSKMVGIPANTLNMRLSRGWSIKKALKTPLMSKSKGAHST